VEKHGNCLRCLVSATFRLRAEFAINQLRLSLSRFRRLGRNQGSAQLNLEGCEKCQKSSKQGYPFAVSASSTQTPQTKPTYELRVRCREDLMRTAQSLVNTLSLLAFSSALGACSATSNDNSSSALPVAVASGSGGNGSGTGGSKGVIGIPTPVNTAFDPKAGIGEPVGNGPCNPKLIGIVRDFNSAQSPVNKHPDFEAYTGQVITKGLVKPILGADGAPEYADPQPPGNPQLTKGTDFQAWYSKAHPANVKFELDLDAPPASANLTKTMDPVTGATTYESTSFFPIDGMGTQAQDNPHGENKATPDAVIGTLAPLHNYHFTFELNTTFKYKPGQVFSFYGDDDLWVFIDKKLVVDVGGTHGQQGGEINLDTLGFTEGSEHELSIFHAERHTTTSNFKATTNIAFSNCMPILR